jgi:hypothetical protein
MKAVTLRLPGLSLHSLHGSFLIERRPPGISCSVKRPLPHSLGSKYDKAEEPASARADRHPGIHRLRKQTGPLADHNQVRGHRGVPRQVPLANPIRK